jgi:hypothetical protein
LNLLQKFTLDTIQQLHRISPLHLAEAESADYGPAEPATSFTLVDSIKLVGQCRWANSKGFDFVTTGLASTSLCFPTVLPFHPHLLSFSMFRIFHLRRRSQAAQTLYPVETGKPTYDNKKGISLVPTTIGQ